jgi:hypothetical protein
MHRQVLDSDTSVPSVYMRQELVSRVPTGADIRPFVRVLSSLLVAACAGAPAPASVATRLDEPTIILREASFENAELAARGRGQLEVLVHSTDRPTQLLSEAQVLIRVNLRDTVRRTTNQQGLARFDSLPIGDHELLVRRIGYGVARAAIPIKPGCRTDAEAYISISAIGIDPPPPMPGRVAITTCR